MVEGRSVTASEIQFFLQKDGVEISIEDATILLDFLYKMAIIVVDLKEPKYEKDS